MVPRLTIRQLWLCLAVILPGLASLLAEVSTVDLAWHLRAGNEILAGAGIPKTDSWTFTVAGQPWLDQQWAAQVLLALTFKVAGWSGLVVLRAVLITAAWALLVHAIRSANPSFPARWVAGLALAAFIVASPALALRSQLFGVVLLCATLALVAGRRAAPRWLWALPFVVAAWANLHGSFPLALVLVGLAWIDDFRSAPMLARRTLTVGIAAAIATLANPFGLAVLAYATSLAANRELAARVTEWQPPSPAEPTGLLFFGSLVAVAVLLFSMRRRPPVPALLALAAFAGLGLAAERGVAWWPAVAAVTLAGLFNREQARRQPGDHPTFGSNSTTVAASGRLPAATPARALNVIVLAVVVLAAVPLLPVWRPADPDLGGAPRSLLAHAPPGLTRELAAIARADDRIWNPQPWGSWFELAVPVAPIAFDSRIELVPAALWADHDAVAGATADWPTVLDRWGVTIIVVAREQSALRTALAMAAAWRRTYEDGDGTLFVRANRDRRVAVDLDASARDRRSGGHPASPILYER
jgi:hypothetical protein